MTGPEDIAGLFNDAFERVWSREAAEIFKDAAKRIEDGVDVDGRPLAPLSGFTIMRKALDADNTGGATSSGIGSHTGKMLRSLKKPLTRLQARRSAGGFSGVQIKVTFGGSAENAKKLGFFLYGRKQARTPGVVAFMRAVVHEARRERVPDPNGNPKYVTAADSGPAFVQPARQVLGVSHARRRKIADELKTLVRAAWATAASNSAKSMSAFDKAHGFIDVVVKAPGGQTLRNIR